jgi:glycosyltransferase involved in cell wall biosynthesis
MMRTSVIIPVYNAAAYVGEAVESALAQPETSEVILIEDGSSENTLPVCEVLAAKYNKVYLFRHPKGENRGAGASRNLGILKSTCEYIAFLDADDFFLPDRFSTAVAIFKANPNVEGVYEAIGTCFEDELARARWRTFKATDLTTVTKEIPPDRLFEALLSNQYGYFSLDGLVVRRSGLRKAGLFDEHLRLHQDTAMILKLSAVATLVPGKLTEPVAMRRVHANNRILARRSTRQYYLNRQMQWNSLWEWGKSNLNGTQQSLLLAAWLYSSTHPRFDLRGYRFHGFFLRRVQLMLLGIEHPWMLGKPAFWRQIAIPEKRQLRISM